MNTDTSLWVSDEGVILVSEAHDLLSNIYNLLDKAVSNSAHTLAFLFNFAFRQHHEVWALQLSIS